MDGGNTVISSLAIEDQLLLEACRVEITAEGAGRINRLIDRGPDWSYVLESSIRHAVAPLLRHGLGLSAAHQSLDGRVPRLLLDDLDVLLRGTRTRNARLLTAVEKISSALREARAEAIGLKDLQLVVDVYPDPALRPMGDVDLLVRRSDWDAAADCLESLGFEPLPSRDVPYLRKYAPAQHFRRGADDLWIDLQWNVMQREWDMYGEGSFTYDGEAMWANAVPIVGLDFELRAPPPEEMLFHLCLHLEGHRYSELILFCDIAELLRREEGSLDWDAVVRRADAYGARASVHQVLVFAGELLDAPLPQEIMRELRGAVFRAGLQGALFGNLTPLHLTLDDIRDKARPPQDVLDSFERVARRQAANGMRLDAEVTGVIDAFVERGGTLVVIDGEPSARLLPDTTLPAFEPLRLFVLEEERELLGDVLRERGYRFDPVTGTGGKCLEWTSADPVLAGETTSLTLAVRWTSDLGDVFAADASSRSIAGSAARSLWQRLRGKSLAGHEPVQVDLIPLRPEALVAAIAARVGERDDDRLFRAAVLVDLLGRLPEPPDALLVEKVARDAGVGRAAEAGLAIASSFGYGVGALAAPTEEPRLLEWARYGSGEASRRPWLRAPYYFTLSLLATQGVQHKVAYLARALFGVRSGPPLLPAMSMQVARGALGLGSRHGTTHLAYWIEPETARRLRFVREVERAD